MQTLLRICSIVALVAIAVYGLTITGTPAHTRMVNEDIERLEEMEALHNALVAYRNRSGHAMPTLDNRFLSTLETGYVGDSNCRIYYNGRSFEAPRLKQYEYSAAADSYKICAEFHNDWQEIRLNKRFYDDNYAWAKSLQKGRNCFERNLPECNQRN